MNNKICLPSDVFYLLMLVNIAIILFSLYQFYNQRINTTASQNQALFLQQQENNALLRANQAELAQQLTELSHNNDTGVTQQFPGEHINTVQGFKVPVYTPTRGEPTDYYVVGYLSKHNKPDKMLRLLERYSGSSRYDYQTIHHIDQGIRIPVLNHNYQQLSDGDLVIVPGYKGKYRVNIYDREAFRRIPY